MEVLARKPGRVLWAGPNAEGRTHYEWRATTAEGVAVEPASCSYTSRHQANLAWAADHPAARPGRPRTASEANRKAGGNPPMMVRLSPDLREAVRVRGGATWVRGLIESARTHLDLRAAEQEADSVSRAAILGAGEGQLLAAHGYLSILALGYECAPPSRADAEELLRLLAD